MGVAMLSVRIFIMNATSVLKGYRHSRLRYLWPQPDSEGKTQLQIRTCIPLKILERRKKLRFNLILPSLFSYCNVLGSAHPQNLLYSVESQPSATFPCNLIIHRAFPF